MLRAPAGDSTAWPNGYRERDGKEAMGVPEDENAHNEE